MKTAWKKLSGFTMVELLVVIVIMGILATISTGAFSTYFAKARNAKRLSAVKSIKTMIQTDSASDWGKNKYFYTKSGDTTTVGDEKGSLDTLISRDGSFAIPEAENGICYIMGFGERAADTSVAPNVAAGNVKVGSDNQFYVATWGEDEGSGEGKIIVDGTRDVVKVLEAATFTIDNFICGDLDTVKSKDTLTNANHVKTTGDGLLEDVQ